ncbi:alpha-xylosidase [Paenibacillus antarcticus]|uniref:alpha-D-xyloside xylohydrolase n=1 Tax=Paenibacillus antarcticus TaxID=253703 RepID=A0A168JT98_9BACL|nr:alpha-xylosidase [Paenibacillus antarcticus]OAB41069.1 alpha-xylosidase [Paenibacillus antarcticus]
MKFSDGNWLTLPGYEVMSPVQAYDPKAQEKSISVYASPRDLKPRWALLDLPLMTVKLSSPMADVIRVSVHRHKGGIVQRPEFEITEQEGIQIETGMETGELWLQSGGLKACVHTEGDWGISFFQNERRITGSGIKSLAHVTREDGQTYMREQLDLGVGEQVYGLGERFTAFVKNGQSFDIWNRDGGTGTEQAYKNIPFYLSSHGYGVFVNNPGLVSFEVGSERVSKVQFSVEGEKLEYFIVGGKTLRDVLRNYTTLTGKPALPPAWTFGLWLTTSFTTNYDEATVMSFVDGMKERDLPLHVFHFDCFWMKALHWTDFEWDEKVFPDPEGMLQRLKETGLKICVWINPYISEQSRLFDEGAERGYFLKRIDGGVWQWDRWQPGMAIVDFTNPDACQWYGDYLRELIDIGVDSFKTDFGERIPTDAVYFDGSDPHRMHNYYTQLYNKVVFEVLEEKLGKGEAALFARSATAGGQQFPVHWGGDCSANFESMAESLRGGLSLGLSGFGFWSHDIGGFENTAPADVYMRWAAFGLLSSHSRLHGNQSYRVPWMFGEEAVDVMRFFTKLKCSLMPYLYGSAVDAHVIGLPMMRAMVLEFPEDPGCRTLDRQYMLGDSLLVAPIFNEEGIAEFYLPSGRWTSFVTGESVEGGSWRSEQHGFMSLPLYARQGSLVPVGAVNTKPDYDYVDGVEVHVFAPVEGVEMHLEIPDLKGNSSFKMNAILNETQLTVELISVDSKAWSLLLRGVTEVESIIGGIGEAVELGMRIRPDIGVTSIVIKYA